MNSPFLSSFVYCLILFTSHFNSARQISAFDLIHYNYKDLFSDLSECCPINHTNTHPIYSWWKPKVVNEFPQVVLLHYIDANGNSSFPCSGTLMSKSHVLTAAHCVTGPILKQSGKLSFIRLGVHNLAHIACSGRNCLDPGIDSRIANVVYHQNFNEPYAQNDIALIRLENPITQFTSNIQPICMRWVHKPDARKVSAGHRFTSIGSQPSLISSKREMSLFDHDACHGKFARRNMTISDGQLCAKRVFKGDACQGDSGGPLISNIDNCPVLDGIVSFENSCGLEQMPGVYTDLTSYSRWIARHMRQ